MDYEIVVYCSHQYADCVDRMYTSWVCSPAKMVRIYTDWSLALSDPKVIVHCDYPTSGHGTDHAARRAESLLKAMGQDTGEAGIGAYVLIDADVWLNALPPLVLSQRRSPIQADMFPQEYRPDPGVVIVTNDTIGFDIVNQWVTLQARMTASGCQGDVSQAAFEKVFASHFPVGRCDHLPSEHPHLRLSHWDGRSTIRLERSSFVHFDKGNWKTRSYEQVLGAPRG